MELIELLGVPHEQYTAKATLQRPSYDYEPLTTLTLDTTTANRIATVAQAVEEVLLNTDVSSTDDFLDACAAELDGKAFNKALKLQNGLKVCDETARKSIEAKIEGILDREV